MRQLRMDEWQCQIIMCVQSSAEGAKLLRNKNVYLEIYNTPKSDISGKHFS